RTHVVSLYFVFFSTSAVLIYLRSFPTRRSSDLLTDYSGWKGEDHFDPPREGAKEFLEELANEYKVVILTTRPSDKVWAWLREHRSGEHTSELQSRENLVCRLLLEKTKKRYYI